MLSGGSDDRPGPDKNSKSTAKKKSRTPINPGRLSSQPKMHTSLSGRSYVPLGTGNPVDYHGPRKQRSVCTSYAPHTFRPPKDIGTSRLSPALTPMHRHLLPPVNERWVLPRVASAFGFVPPPPPPPVADDTNAHLIGLILGDKDSLGRVFIEPDGSTWYPASKEVNKAVRESVRRLFSQP
ncbi:hypothetical protein P3S67_008088 [Capsicum chacoense]